MTQLGPAGEDECAGQTDTKMLRKIKKERGKNRVRYREEEEVVGGACELADQRGPL